ncbi:MAG: rhamnulokinase [Bryobacterales bacterium]|nr:rhamnulokinase [Bryobacterales bacterium]
MLGTLAEGRLSLTELHRFPNEPVWVGEALYWDALRLFHEIRRGLAAAGRERRLTLDGVAVDTWGVDFALLDESGALIDNPRHYRDARTSGIPERLFRTLPREQIHRRTGVQFMQINTLYQLHAMLGTPALERAGTLLMMPDLFHYWLTGVIRGEVTIASTTQFFDPRARCWAGDLLEGAGIPPAILPELVEPGTLLAPLRDEVARAAGLDPAPVFATGCHDTASAVAAVPAQGDGWCYISSGTWSLMGVETAEPVIDERSLAMGLTNEAGVAGRTRLLRNIAGLWLLQECRRAWVLEGHEWTYADLTRAAAAAPPFVAVLDPDAFLAPGGMPDQIAAFCARTGQPAPQDEASIARTILESLALRYRQVLEMLESLLGRRLEPIHIVGGGSRNTLLNEFVAGATGRAVMAGPAEATAAGNVLVQAMGAGAVDSIEEIRAIVRRSFDAVTVEPEPSAAWDDAYARFLRIQGAS